MKIIVQTNNLKCDMGTCANRADYSVIPSDGDKRSYLNLCKDCMSAFYSQARTLFKRVPVKKGENK